MVEVMTNKEIEIINVIDKIRPYIQRDGGDVEYVSFEDGIVRVRLLGACVGCMAIGSTLKEGIEAIIMDEVPGIKAVELAEEML